MRRLAVLRNRQDEEREQGQQEGGGWQSRGSLKNLALSRAVPTEREMHGGGGGPKKRSKANWIGKRERS